MERDLARFTGRALAHGVGLTAGAYAAYAGTTWLRYGHVRLPAGDERDSRIDRFMPTYEIVERHYVRVAAPADVTYAAALEVDLESSAIISAIFRTRAFVLGAAAGPSHVGQGLLRWAHAIGWRSLAEDPGREVVLGAVTRPWDANVIFRSIEPTAFAAFCESDYVKIVWTLRTDPSSDGHSIARTETRAVATDRRARAKFRRYWAAFAPGIQVIRRAALGLVKAEAERRVRRARPKSADRFELASRGDLDVQC